MNYNDTRTKALLDIPANDFNTTWSVSKFSVLFEVYGTNTHTHVHMSIFTHRTQVKFILIDQSDYQYIAVIHLFTGSCVIMPYGVFLDSLNSHIYDVES